MKKHTLATALVSLLAAGMASAVTVNVKITSIAPDGGVALAPIWVGAHDGTFDSFDANAGQTASPGLELLAELGDTSVFSSEFNAAAPGGVDGSTGGPLPAGAMLELDLDLAADGSNDYLSLLGMVLPTNDYFIGNGNPLAFDISSVLNGGGPVSFDLGSTVYNAGTELEDFAFSAPPNSAPLFPFLNGLPTNPPGGTDENGTITSVTSNDPFGSFANGPSGGVPANLNFNDSALYPNGLINVTVSAPGAQAVPEPGAALSLALLAGVVGFRRRRRSA